MYSPYDTIHYIPIVVYVIRKVYSSHYNLHDDMLNDVKSESLFTKMCPHSIPVYTHLTYKTRVRLHNIFRCRGVRAIFLSAPISKPARDVVARLILMKRRWEFRICKCGLFIPRMYIDVPEYFADIYHSCDSYKFFLLHYHWLQPA